MSVVAEHVAPQLRRSQSAAATDKRLVTATTATAGLRSSSATVVIFAALALVWELAVRIFHTGSGALPAPSQIVRRLWLDRSIYPGALRVTAGEALRGFAVAVVIAGLVALACIALPAAERFIMRVSLTIYCLPLIAIAPILDLVLSEDGPRVALAAISAFFPVLIGGLAGLQAVPTLELDLIRAYGGNSIAEIRYVRIRAAAGGMIGGMKVGVTAAVLGAIIGELIGAERGLGVLMLTAQKGLRADRTWGVALVAAALAGAFYIVVVCCERLVGARFANGSATVSATSRRTLVGRSVSSAGVLIASILTLIGGWWLAVEFVDTSPILVKDPLDIWRSYFTDVGASARRTELLDPLWITLQHAGFAAAAGMSAAIMLAGLFLVIPALRRPLLSIAVVFQTIPAVAFLPLFVLLFGRQLMCVAVFGIVCVLFPSLITLLSGLDNASPSSIDVVHAAGGGRWAALRAVRFPGSLASLFAAARIAVPNAITGALVAEWLATGTGLGRVMTSSGARLNYGAIWASAVLVTAVSAMAYSFVSVVERHVLSRRFGTAARVR